MRKIQEHPELLTQAAVWFHQKWGIPEAAYAESMKACLKKAALSPSGML